MKNYLIMIGSFALVISTGCNNKAGSSKEADTQNADSSRDKQVIETPVTELTHSFNDVDSKTAASLKTIVDYYLQIKNALAGDNADKAASNAKVLEKLLRELDKSLFTAEQKKVYDQDEEELKEHAEHIGKNGDNIKHQRSHFSMMSEVMYNLVKSFGAGQPIYHDHCPMYKDGKGGMWLSEIKEVKNPYFGAEMPACGTVEEIIK